MPDYEKMYNRLFQTQVQVIAILQKAHQDTEEMYISAPIPNIWLLEPKKQDKELPDGKLQ